jgi:hypothetical protein
MIDESLQYLIVIAGTLILGNIFFINPIRAVVYMVAFQKVIDILWFVPISVGGFKLTVPRLVYSIIPAVVALIIPSYKRKVNLPLQMPIVIVFMGGFLLCYIMGIMKMSVEKADTQFAIEVLLKIISGFSMFWVGWYYLDNEEKYDRFANLFVFSYLIAFAGVMLQFTGTFTMGSIGVAQQTASQTGAEALTGGEMTSRYAGFYNDAGTATMYLFTAIPLCLYFIYKGAKKVWLYQIMFAISIVGVILGFVRGTWLTVIIGLFAWLIINKDYVKIAVILGLAIILTSTGAFVSQFFQVFFADIFNSIEAGKLVGISGKAIRIEMIKDSFADMSLLNQVFGAGIGSAAQSISAITGNEYESAETDFYAYLHDMGMVGWLFYYGIPLVSAFLVWQNIKKCDPKIYGKALRLKYCVSFAMVMMAFFAFFGSGSKWVSFTFPLYLLLGFALKPPKYFLLKQYQNQQKLIVIRSQLQPQLS